MNSTIAVRDPVCGMDIEAATAAGRTEHKRQTYYFYCTLHSAKAVAA